MFLNIDHELFEMHTISLQDAHPHPVALFHNDAIRAVKSLHPHFTRVLFCVTSLHPLGFVTETGHRSSSRPDAPPLPDPQP
jgi:hypothetical protein